MRQIGLLVSSILTLMGPGWAQNAVPPQNANTNAQALLDRGAAAFKSARYPEAAQDFQEAEGADSTNITAHLYRGTALEMQYVPGLDTPENVRFADDATVEFKTVLSLDARNSLALASLATLAYNQKKFDEAESWNKAVLTVDPDNKEAYYTLGVLAWTEWLPVDRQARTDSGQSASAPGPIQNASLRNSLKVKWMPMLDEGIRDMESALRIDPNYDDAMAYMNLLIRYRADLLDTPAEYAADVSRADNWMARSLAAKKSKEPNPAFASAAEPTSQASNRGGDGLIASSGSASSGSVTASSALPGGKPVAVRVGGSVAQASLVSQVAPAYPPLARQARITGLVRFNVRIGRDGHVETMQLISGHPLLVQAATDAVRQWVYKPTLLNGNPVAVLTTVDVNFNLVK